MTLFMERSHPEHEAETEAARETALGTELRECAARIEAHRRARRPVPSDRAWVREWPGLGSPKTWALVMAGDLAGINVAAKLPDYRGVLAALETESRVRATEELYPDLAGAQETELAVLRLMHHRGKDRFILIEGGSGSGKTSALDLLATGPASGSMVRTEADETWKSLRAGIRKLLEAMAVPEAKIPMETGKMMDLLVETVSRKGRIIIALDEAHHVNGQFLNLAKTLLNRTECMLILAGMATLFQKLRANASQEAGQLFHNRLFCRVRLTGPDKAGARIWLARRMSADGSKWKDSTMDAIAKAAMHCGHWSYLRRVVDQLHANGTGDPDDAALLGAADAAAKEIA